MSLPLTWASFEETRAHIRYKPHNTTTVDESVVPPDEESATHILYEALVRPSYLLVTEPVVFFFTLLSALSYGLVFVATQSDVQVYTELYHWEEWQAGVVQVSVVIGELIGFIACMFQNRMFSQRVDRNEGLPALESNVPESRLYLCIPGSFIGLGGGLFWYGWTSYPFLPWVLPSVGLGLVGFGSMTVMQAIMVYITDSYDAYAGSASAAVCFGENVFAAVLPLSTHALYSDLGFQWASSLLGFIALALSFAPVILLIKGRDVRRRSLFMRRAATGIVQA